MKTIISLSLIALLSLSLAVACSSGSAGPSCEDICNKALECDSVTELTECLNECPRTIDMYRDEVWSALGNCLLESTCEELEANEDNCYEQALAKGSLPAALSTIERLCAKEISCDSQGTLTLQQCIDDSTGADGDPSFIYQFMSLLSDSVLDCIGTCVEGKDCTELASGDVDCFAECGVDFS